MDLSASPFSIFLPRTACLVFTMPCHLISTCYGHPRIPLAYIGRGEIHKSVTRIHIFPIFRVVLHLLLNLLDLEFAILMCSWYVAPPLFCWLFSLVHSFNTIFAQLSLSIYIYLYVLYIFVISYACKRVMHTSSICGNTVDATKIWWQQKARMQCKHVSVQEKREHDEEKLSSRCRL